MATANNKYYEMRKNANATFDVFYGRVGGLRSKATHPIAQWDQKLREKKAQGYIDQTHLLAETRPATPPESMKLTIEPVLDSHVLTLIKRMMRSDWKAPLPYDTRSTTPFSIRMSGSKRIVKPLRSGTATAAKTGWIC